MNDSDSKYFQALLLRKCLLQEISRVKDNENKIYFLVKRTPQNKYFELLSVIDVLRQIVDNSISIGNFRKALLYIIIFQKKIDDILLDKKIDDDIKKYFINDSNKFSFQHFFKQFLKAIFIVRYWFSDGAHQRVQNEIEYYDNLQTQLEQINKEHEVRRLQINDTLLKVIDVKKDAVITIKKYLTILNTVDIEQRDIDKQNGRNIVDDNYSLEKINASITAGDIAISASKDTVAGISSALGAWALVGTFEAASIGTAISTLSGAVATNTNLAFLEGGSNAAGGENIAAGRSVMSRLFDLPFIAISRIFQHLTANKKIEQLNEEETKVLEHIDKVNENIVRFDAIERKSEEVIKSINKSMTACECVYNDVYRSIFPLGFITKASKFINKKIRNKPYFSDNDYDSIQKLGKITESILEMVDAPIFK